MNKTIGLLLTLIFCIGCATTPQISQKKNSLSKPPIKSVSKPVVKRVFKDPKAYSIMSYDSDFIYVFSHQVTPPKKVFVIGDTEYYSSDFAERIMQELPGCNGDEVEIWKYKIKKDNLGIPITGNIALDAEFLSFKKSEEISLKEKTYSDTSCLRNGSDRIDIIKCDTNLTFLVDNVELVKVYPQSSEPFDLDFLGILSINDQKFYYVKTIADEKKEIHLQTANQKNLNVDKPGECSKNSQDIQDDDEFESDVQAEAFEIKEIKDDRVQILADGQFPKYKRLQVLSGDQVFLADYEVESEEQFDHGGGSVEVQKSWNYKIEDNFSKADLAFPYGSIENVRLNINRDNPVPVLGELRESISQTMKDTKIANTSPAKIDEVCLNFIWNEVQELNCGFTSFFAINGKRIVSYKYDKTKDDPFIKLIAKIKAKNKLFYVLSSSREIAGYIIIAEDGDTLPVIYDKRRHGFGH